MTEAEWVAADLAALMSHLQGERKYLRTAAGRRRLRLFACACCRFVWAAIESDPAKRKELYAEFQQIVANDLPVYWINALPYHTAYDKKLMNVPTGIWGTMHPMDMVSWGE